MRRNVRRRHAATAVEAGGTPVMRVLCIVLLLLGTGACKRILTEPEGELRLFSTDAFSYGYIPGSRD